MTTKFDFGAAYHWVSNRKYPKVNNVDFRLFRGGEAGQVIREWENHPTPGNKSEILTPDKLAFLERKLNEGHIVQTCPTYEATPPQPEPITASAPAPTAPILDAPAVDVLAVGVEKQATEERGCQSPCSRIVGIDITSLDERFYVKAVNTPDGVLLTLQVDAD